MSREDKSETPQVNATATASAWHRWPCSTHAAPPLGPGHLLANQ